MFQPVDVLGLGNSLIDIIALTDDAYLLAQDMAKGAMTLIDEERAEALYAARREPKIVCGGSAANTIVGVASFGVSAAYIGKVKHDELGGIFGDDLRATGVAYATALAAHGPGTGRCFVYVTPDGERTMNTFLGASTYLSPDDVDEALVRSARFVYLEGYMWDRPAAKEAFRKAGRIAHEAGARVALTLSDAFCVDRFRGEFIDLMRTGIVDTVFANTDEALSLYQTTHLARGARRVRRRGRLRGGDALGERLGDRRGRGAHRGAGAPHRAARRHHGRGRSVRRRLSRRPRARPCGGRLRAAWRRWRRARSSSTSARGPRLRCARWRRKRA